MCAARIEKWVKFIVKGFILSTILAMVSYPVVKLFNLEEFNYIRYYAVMLFYAIWLIINITTDIIIIKKIEKMRGE